MKIEIMLFGQLTDLLKASSVTVDGANDTNELNRELLKQYPVLTTTRYIVAVNKRTVTENTTLTEGSTVALLPPFSGG